MNILLMVQTDRVKKTGKGNDEKEQMYGVAGNYF